MSDMKIRPARPEDAADFFDVRCSVKENYMSPSELTALGVTPEAIGEMIASGDYIAPVVIVDDKIVGLAIAQISEGYVFALFIRPEYEGRGLGRALMHVLESGLMSMALPRRGSAPAQKKEYVLQVFIGISVG